MKRNTKTMKLVIPILAVLASVVVLIALPGCEREVEERGSGTAAASVWTCSMHPSVRSDGPGDCPLCGMDLIPVEVGPEELETSDRALTVSEAGRKLMDIETARVERRAVHVEIGLVGRVTYDEGRVERITAWVPGRVERLYVDRVGRVIRAGEPMVELYGPELVAAQEELLQSRRALVEAEVRDRPGVAATASATLDAVRDRLRLWGLSDAQITEIEERGSPRPSMTIQAPAAGVVVSKDVDEGQYVMTGTSLFTIVDLSVVWIELAAYESDLPWLAEGQDVDFTVEALPGEAFHGTVSLVEPTVDPMTRTVTVQAEIDNEDGRLKPDMFVRATVDAAARGSGGGEPLTIPATAPLLTGERAVVYVQIEGADLPTFEGREVVLGPRAGDYYVVVSGLAAGERVVTNGAFKIDSALQIRAQPSMMSPEGEDGERPVAGHVH